MGTRPRRCRAALHPGRSPPVRSTRSASRRTAARRVGRSVAGGAWRAPLFPPSAGSTRAALPRSSGPRSAATRCADATDRGRHRVPVTLRMRARSRAVRNSGPRALGSSVARADRGSCSSSARCVDPGSTSAQHRYRSAPREGMRRQRDHAPSPSAACADPRRRRPRYLRPPFDRLTSGTAGPEGPTRQPIRSGGAPDTKRAPDGVAGRSTQGDGIDGSSRRPSGRVRPCACSSRATRASGSA
jgi:hypothetical protein